MNKLSKTRGITYTAISVAIIALLSQISIPIGPIPLSLGILGVFLISGTLGLGYGSLAVFIYVAMGAMGLPVFAGFKGGLDAILGATGGFIMGYQTIPIIMGIAIKIFGNNHISQIISMLISLLVVYMIGAAWFVNYLSTTFLNALQKCVIPFILPDCIKILLADVVIIRLRKVLRIPLCRSKGQKTAEIEINQH